MLNRFFYSYLLILLAFVTSSCSKDEIYDKSKAVSAFYQSDVLEISKNKLETKIEAPKQVKSWNFGDNFHQNGKIGNFKKSFAYKKDRLVLKPEGKINLDFGFFGHDVNSSLPVINNNKAYFLDHLGNLTAYDLQNLKRIWQQELFDRSFFEKLKNPKIFAAKDKIFAISGNNQIAALNLENGKILWQRKLPSLLISKPIMRHDKLYILSDSNELFALNADNGRVLWSHSAVLNRTTISGAADPVIYDKYILASYSSGEIYALNKDSGEEIWSYDLNLNKAINSNFYLNDIDATPIVKAGRVYVSGNGGLMMAIDVKSGDVIWKKNIASIIDFHLGGNFLYVINDENKLIALTTESGAIKWIKQLKSYKNPEKPQSKIIYNGVMMVGGKILVTSSQGRLLILSPIDGSLENKIKIGGTILHNPIILQDKIYLLKQGFFARYFVGLK